MTKTSPFSNRYTTRNAKTFAFRLQTEIEQARANVYNLLRSQYPIADYPIDEVRAFVKRNGSAKHREQLEFADRLYTAQEALLELQLVLK